MDMTIDEFMSKQKIHKNSVVDSDDFDRFLGIFLSKMDLSISLQIVETDYIFPRLLTINDESTLLWDVTYWKLYKEYLCVFSHLNFMEKQKLALSDEYKLSQYSKLFFPFSYYLALIINDHIISNQFALYYQEISNQGIELELGMPLENFAEYIRIAKMYLLFHEIRHYQYKKDRDEKNKDIDNMVLMLDNERKIINKLDNRFCQEKYLKSKKQLLEYIDTACVNTNMLEELICDTFAFNHCIHFFGFFSEKNTLWQKL